MANERFRSASTYRAERQAAAARGVRVAARIEGDGLEMLQGAIQLLGETDASRALSRAVNHTGRKASTQVKRTLAKEIGLTQKRMVELGRIKFVGPRDGTKNPEASIQSTGRFIPLGEFRPTQVKAGVKASPFGNRRLYPGTFIFAGNRKSGQRMPNGHVFRNTGTFNSKSGRDNQSAPLWGPAVPKEMVEEATAGQFTTIVNRDLPDRVAHEVERLTSGVISR